MPTSEITKTDIDMKMLLKKSLRGVQKGTGL